MRKLSLLLSLLLFAFLGKAQVNHLVISQLYGGGGNTNAVYKNDFVELFNPTAASITINNWSVQYAAAAGTTWQVATITSATIAPGKYFLLQLGSGGAVGADLPTPDATAASINMSTTAGKVALVNGTTALTGSCPGGSSVIDLVGFGNTATCFEGPGAAAAPSTANGIARNNNGCTDTDNNTSDFTAAAPNPRNSSFAANVCPVVGSAISVSSISTVPFCINVSEGANGVVNYTANGTFNTTFTAYLSDASGSFAAPVAIGSTAVNGTNPTGSINITIPAGLTSGSGYKLRIDASSLITNGTPSSAFEIINGVNNVTALSATQAIVSATINWTNPAACYDEIMLVAKQGSSITAIPSGDGSAYTGNTNFAGNGTPFDGGKVVYKGTISGQTVTGLTTGGNYYIKAFVRRGTSWSTGTEINIPSLGQLNHLVISQVYGGGGNSGATYTHDFIELFNPTANPISLTGYSVQYTGGTGTSWQKLDLSGTVPGYRYFLIQMAAGSGNGVALPTPDQTGSIAMAAASGKVALVNGTAALSGGCPTNSVIDFVGYGTSTDCSEGNATAPAAGNALGVLRANGGCVDTDVNGNDFSAATPVARNSAAPANNCATGSGALPVRFTTIKAAQKGTGIEVSWVNAAEEDVLSYSVERSPDGRNFTALSSLPASINNGSRATYNYVDATPLSGDNSYRVKAVETTGKTVYSTLVRINLGAAPALVLYPNPVTGGELSLQMTKLPAGKYHLQIINTAGQVIREKSFVHPGGALTESLPVNGWASGVYQLQLVGPVQLQKTWVKE